jgi:hypothetical protein
MADDAAAIRASALALPTRYFKLSPLNCSRALCSTFPCKLQKFTSGGVYSRQISSPWKTESASPPVLFLGVISEAGPWWLIFCNVTVTMGGE